MYDDLFAQFWSTYPKKVAKQKAYRAFCKLKPTSQLLGIILDDVSRRSKTDQWKKDGGQYIPYPTSYLNDRRWEDEVSVPSISKEDHSYDLEAYKRLVNQF